MRCVIANRAAIGAGDFSFVGKRSQIAAGGGFGDAEQTADAGDREVTVAFEQGTQTFAASVDLLEGGFQNGLSKGGFMIEVNHKKRPPESDGTPLKV